MAKTPSPPQWDPQMSNCWCRALISNPKTPSSAGLGGISPLSSKTLHPSTAQGQATALSRGKKNQPKNQIIYKGGGEDTL